MYFVSFRKLSFNAAKHKTKKKKLGTLALEIGNGQHLKVSQILKDQGFRSRILVKDYQNNVRCIIASLEK